MARPNFGRRYQAMHAAGKMAKPIYVCRGCGTWHNPVTRQVPMNTPAGVVTVDKDGPPDHCINSDCGRLDFDRFMSKVEATKWATLLLSEKMGNITGLQKQVRFPLYAYFEGKPIEVAVYIADFVFVTVADGVTHVVDVKPKRGIDDLARLKLKWMDAMGIRVEIAT